jgi:putative transposase
MANPYPIALRERAVRAYENSTDTYADVAARFDIGLNTLLRWVQRARTTGDVAPLDKGGGWRSPIDLTTLHRLVAERPDRTTAELTRAYNAAVPSHARAHRSSVLRALRRSGCVFKRNGRDRRNRIVRTSKPSAPPSGTGSRA